MFPEGNFGGLGQVRRVWNEVVACPKSAIRILCVDTEWRMTFPVSTSIRFVGAALSYVLLLDGDAISKFDLEYVHATEFNRVDLTPRGFPSCAKRPLECGFTGIRSK